MGGLARAFNGVGAVDAAADTWTTGPSLPQPRLAPIRLTLDNDGLFCATGYYIQNYSIAWIVRFV